MKKQVPGHVAFVNTHPIQYFAPLYAYLHATGEFSVTALYLSDYSIRGAADRGFERVVQWDIDLLAGYDARFVDGAGRRNAPDGFLSYIAPHLWHDVRTGGFDAVVIHGHTPASMLVAAAAAKAAGIPVFMHGETHLGLKRSRAKGLFRRPVMGALYRTFNGVLAIGSANAFFYRAMGVPERRIFSMPYTVDNARFIAASQFRRAERAEQRARLGVLDDRPVVLFAAKFQARKRPGDLIRAAARLAQDGILFHVVMVGSGELESALRVLCRDLGLKNVHFAGFVNQDAMPRVYAASDLFVLPSDNEPWGLAINEAMCAGLPIIASAEIGCVPDLVHDGMNGLTFAAGDVGGLTQTLRLLVQSAELRERMGAASRDMISRWSYAECEQGLRQALHCVGLGKRRTPDAIEAAR
jgi:glycosyltransferase involved in cell wall biosynthesis